MRSVIVWLCGQPWRWTVQSVASMSRSAPSRARAYLTQLVSLRVLVIEDTEAFRPGPGWAQWVRKQSLSHPGGSSREYRRAAAERAEQYRAEHQERMRLASVLRSKRGGRPVAPIARAAQVSHSVLFDLEAGRITVRPETLARIMKALEELCREN